jgi:hypothetical protein
MGFVGADVEDERGRQAIFAADCRYLGRRAGVEGGVGGLRDDGDPFGGRVEILLQVARR